MYCVLDEDAVVFWIYGSRDLVMQGSRGFRLKTSSKQIFNY